VSIKSLQKDIDRLKEILVESLDSSEFNDKTVGFQISLLENIAALKREIAELQDSKTKPIPETPTRFEYLGYLCERKRGDFFGCRGRPRSKFGWLLTHIESSKEHRLKPNSNGSVPKSFAKTYVEALAGVQ